MDTATLAVPASIEAMRMPARRLFGAYLAEARSECLRYLRNPGFMLPVLLFPSLFYLVFGILMAKSEGTEASRYLLASYGVFGVMSPGLFGFGVSLAFERDGGLLTLKRALPMPPGAYLLGKLVMAMGAAAIVVLLLLALAFALAHVSLTPQQAGSLLVTGVFGVMPFCAIGMLVGSVARGQGAPGMLQIIYLPMSFLSGLWFPLPMLPKVLQQIAPLWPSYHLERIALAAVGVEPTARWPHVLVLAGWAVVCLWLAARRLQRHG
jgi:ABC-2 type transport system permease protein